MKGGNLIFIFNNGKIVDMKARDDKSDELTSKYLSRVVRLFARRFFRKYFFWVKFVNFF